MGLTVAVGCLLFAGPGSACSDSCGDADCGSGVGVEWQPESLPEGVVAVQLCVDRRCDDPERPTGAAAPSSAPGVEDITVELRLLGTDNRVVDTWRWTGDREGGCCPYVDLMERGGELVPKQIG
ncbi:MAG: hypothetical protein ACO1PW_03525 [Actinomycetota bacterium]